MRLIGVIGVGALPVEERIAVPVVVLGDPAGRGILIEVPRSRLLGTFVMYGKIRFD